MILSLVVVVIALCSANIYLTLGKMRTTARGGGGGLFTDPSGDLPILSFEFLRGAIEVNGMPVVWDPDLRYQTFLDARQKDGWTQVEADWDRAQSAFMGRAMMLQREGEVCFVMQVPGKERGVLHTTMDAGHGEVIHDADPWQAEVDAPGRDLDLLPRLPETVRVFSMIFESGAGAVTYRVRGFDADEAIAQYEGQMAAADWSRVFGGQGTAFHWYQHGADQCVWWLSSIDEVSGVYLSVFYLPGSQM